MATHNKDILKTLAKRIISLDKGFLVRDDNEKKEKDTLEHSNKKSGIIDIQGKKPKEVEDENF